MSDEMASPEPQRLAAGATLVCAAKVAPQRLSAWRDGLLADEQAAELGAHVANCPACSERLRAYDRIGAALREQTIPRAGEDRWLAMRRRLASQRGDERPPSAPRRRAWGGLGALVAAALLIALFAGLLAHQAAQRPTPATTATVTQATTTPTAPPAAMGAAWTQIPGYQGLYNLAVAPSDPRVAYQLWNDPNGALLFRRSDDQGATWHALTLPTIPNASYPVVGAASYTVVSPFDAHVVYLLIDAVMYAPITTCSSNGGGESSPKAPLCRYQYISTDAGADWQPLSLPVVGDFNALQGQSDASAQPATTRLYAVATPLGAATSALVRSDDGGVTWSQIDGDITSAGQGVTFYSATPTGSTIFALSAPSGRQLGTFPPLTIWRSDDAGATWANQGQAPSGDVYSMQAALVVSSGKPILYLLFTPNAVSGSETILGSLYGASGSFLTAPETSPQCTTTNPSEFVGARADGSVIVWCGGALQSWLYAPARAADSGWRTLTQDPQTSSIQNTFMQTLPDGSERVWLVIGNNQGAEVEYATLPN